MSCRRFFDLLTFWGKFVLHILLEQWHACVTGWKRRSNGTGNQLATPNIRHWEWLNDGWCLSSCTAWGTMVYGNAEVKRITACWDIYIERKGVKEMEREGLERGGSNKKHWSYCRAVYYMLTFTCWPCCDPFAGDVAHNWLFTIQLVSIIADEGNIASSIQCWIECKLTILGGVQLRTVNHCR